MRRRAGRARREVRQRLRVRPELSVVVIDGPGAEATHASLEAQHAGRRVEVLSAAGGPVAALLAGAAGARGDHVTVLAAGETVEPGWAQAVLAALRPGAVVFARGTAPAASALAAALRTVRGAVLPVAAVRSATAPVDPAPLDETVLLAAVLAGREHRFCRVAARPPAPGAVDAAAALALVRRLAREAPPELAAAAASAVVAAIDPAARADSDARTALRREVSDVAGADPAAVNHGLARDLAILYVSLPFADTAGNIAARRVRAQGALVDVVSADLRKHRGTDHSADPLWTDHLDEHVMLPGAATVQGDWTAITRFCRDGERAIAERERRKGPYRSVYSRTMFPGAHLLAAAHKLSHPDVSWLAEFSDPQLINPKGETRRSTGEPDPALLDRLAAGLRERGVARPAGDNVWAWAETVAYALADTVLFTNDHQREFMLGYCADPALARRAREHSRVEHHPAPPPALYSAAAPDYPLPAGRVHIGYFGTFYPTRSLAEVLGALAGLGAADRERVQLHVFTKRPAALRDEAAALGIGDAVVAADYVPFADYLALATRFDVLLVNDYATAGTLAVNPFLPAKYADYRGSGTAVWGIVEPGSVLSGMPLAHRSELGDVEGARRVLAELAGAGHP